MAKATLILTGDKQLNRRLAMLTSNQAKSAIRKAARPAIKLLLPRIKRATPSDTGFLRSSIKIKALSRSRKRIGVRIGTGERQSGAMFAGKTFYGSFIEFGKRKGGRYVRSGNGKRKLIGGTPKHGAVHMIENTAERNKDRVLRVYRFLLKHRIEELARKTK